jgi:MFS family permease
MQNLTLYLAQRFLFMISHQMMSVAVGWQVYELTGSPLNLGLVGLVQFVPVISLSLLAGHAADRFPRKNIVLVSYFLDLLCCLALGAFTFLHSMHEIYIFLIMFFVGVARTFAGAASQSLLPSLVTEEKFTKAVAMNSSVWQLAVILGPTLGGLIYGIRGTAGAVYATCTVTLLSSIFSMWKVMAPREMMDRNPLRWDTLFAGIRYVWEKKVILGAISMDLFAVLLGGAVALLPAYAKDILKIGPLGLGMLRSAPGAGAGIIALLLTFFPLRQRVGKKMFGCVALFGLGTIVFGISRNFYLSLICLFVMGASDQVSVVIRQTLVQIFTPNQMRGRVSAVNLIFIGASNELGEFESGITAAWWGIVPAVVFGGIGTCLIVLAWAILFPQLFKMENFEKR